MKRSRFCSAALYVFMHKFCPKLSIWPISTKFTPMIYIVGKLCILAFIRRWAIASILKAVRILLPSWDRIMHSYTVSYQYHWSSAPINQTLKDPNLSIDRCGQWKPILQCALSLIWFLLASITSYRRASHALQYLFNTLALLYYKAGQQV